MKKLVLCVVALSSTLALAAPPAAVPAGPPPGRPGPGRFDGPGPGGEDRAERREQMEQRMRMMAVLAISEALSLTEAEALKMSERLKGFEEKRRPVREQMHEATRTLKAAADGDQAALGGVDAAVLKVLDGRAQMAALDKELYTSLSQGQTPQKRAKLALVMGRLQHQMKEARGERGGKGRRHGEGRGPRD